MVSVWGNCFAHMSQYSETSFSLCTCCSSRKNLLSFKDQSLWKIRGKHAWVHTLTCSVTHSIFSSTATDSTCLKGNPNYYELLMRWIFGIVAVTQSSFSCSADKPLPVMRELVITYFNFWYIRDKLNKSCRQVCLLQKHLRGIYQETKQISCMTTYSKNSFHHLTLWTWSSFMYIM